MWTFYFVSALSTTVVRVVFRPAAAFVLVVPASDLMPALCSPLRPPPQPPAPASSHRGQRRRVCIPGGIDPPPTDSVGVMPDANDLTLVRSRGPGGESQLRTKAIIVSTSVHLVRHPRGSHRVYPLLYLNVATPENRSINSTLSSMYVQESPPHKRFLLIVGCSSPFMRLAQHLAALRAWCKQCLSCRRKPDVLLSLIHI